MRRRITAFLTDHQEWALQRLHAALDDLNVAIATHDDEDIRRRTARYVDARRTYARATTWLNTWNRRRRGDRS